MAGRSVFHKEFGQYLAGLREKTTGWNQSDLARFGAKLFPVLTRQILIGLESGKTQNPDPDVLRALASLYEVPYEEIVGRFISCRYGLDLQTGVDSPLVLRGRHGASTSSDPALVRQLHDRDAIIKKGREAAADLVTLLAPRAETPNPRAKESRRRPSP